MGSGRLEVMWSPFHHDRFITYGNDIYLYEVIKSQYIKQSDISMSETTAARLIGTNTNHRYVKCIDIYRRFEPDLLLAVGHANGKISLATFGQSIFDLNGLSSLELEPRHARQCNVLKWNPVEVNLLASGFEKHRSDHGIHIWDAMNVPHQSKLYNTYNSVLGAQGFDYIRPIIEIGLADSANSLEWFNNSPHTLIAGINSRQLKIIDIRDPSNGTSSLYTKLIYGLEISPHNERHVVSFGDNQIGLWDTRNIEKPILIVNQNKNVTKVSWCKTRRNLLGSLQKESPAIHLHDMQRSTAENEPSPLYRTVQPPSDVPLVSFSWHPFHENRLVAVSHSGTLVDYVMFERVTLNWAASSHIVWTCGRKYLRIINENNRIYGTSKDLTPEIKRRALAEYGLKGELSENGDISEDSTLKTAWSWLSLSRFLVQSRRIASVSSIRHPGVRCVLGLDVSSHYVAYRSEVVNARWSDVASSVKLYRSKGRDDALLLCGWRFDKGVSILDKLELEGSYCRAAAIAMFSLELRLAIDILNRAAIKEPQLAVIAMALSGYTSEQESLWKELCVSTKEQLSDPYLKAIFTFLISDTSDYETILEDEWKTMISIEDCVAFACKYLPDVKLQKYLNKLTTSLSKEGNILAIILTGTSEECIPLLGNYLDKTGDVQTVSLIALRCFPSSVFINNIYVDDWIQSYRLLLDSLKLWTQRVKFDILLHADNPPPESVYIVCNFCTKSISTSMKEEEEEEEEKEEEAEKAEKAENTNKKPQSPPNNTNPVSSSNKQQKISQGSEPKEGFPFHDEVASCTSCHKPLPRCAICLANMGTGTTYCGPLAEDKIIRSFKVAEISTWFTWCQTCRHGGHSSHLLSWFREHVECPVAGCECHCIMLDE